MKLLQWLLTDQQQTTTMHRTFKRGGRKLTGIEKLEIVLGVVCVVIVAAITIYFKTR